MKNIFLYPLLVVLVAGCDRLAKDNSAKIQIQMPSELSKVSSTSVNGVMPVPDGLSGVAGVNTPINCYLVGVNGPEAEMSRNTCNRKDGTREFKLGQWAGGIAPGGSVTLDVPSGKNRNFYVVGFHAVGNTCHDFKAGFPEHDVISNPYIIGKMEAVTLNAGETKDLPIKVAFDSDGWFEDCKGPDFPDDDRGGGGGNGNTPPTKILLSKNQFPYQHLINYTSNICQHIDVSLVDDLGFQKSLPSAVTFDLISTSGTFQAFSNIEDCRTGGTAITSVTIPQNTYNHQVIVKSTSSTGMALNFQASAIVADVPLTSTQLPLTVAADSQKSFLIDTPWSALPSLCYPVDVTLQYAGYGSPFSDSSAFNIAVTGAGVTFYSTASCDSPTPNISIPALNQTTRFYMKVASVTVGSTAINISTAHSTFVSATKNVRIGAGTAVPYAFEIQGNNKVTGYGCSSGRYRATLVNQYHTPVIAPNAFPLTFTSDTPADIGFYGDNVCSMSAPTNLSAGSYYTDVYFKGLAVNGYGNRQINVAATGLVSGTYAINFDGPFRFAASASTTSPMSGACFSINAGVLNQAGMPLPSSFRDFHISYSDPSITVVMYDTGCSSAQTTMSPNTLYGPYQTDGPLFFKVTNLSGSPKSFSPIISDAASGTFPIHPMSPGLMFNINPP